MKDAIYLTVNRQGVQSMRKNGSLKNLLWSCKYPDFESLITEWEIV